ncbi:DMT family transporter [Pseudomonas sp. Irchel 3E13]|jgi:drug/metabolite transporter (DMT)-like permease|uniref:DMT family transporter n=1 Tax=Pseudomonas sp. Irchel 3E13 TaxID=2008975 RepID=UPI000BA32417|nr:DMT family transporter [Pseudomonas sp. Irchel 3E13]
MSAVRRAIICKLVSALLIAGMYGLIKGLGQDYPVGQILFVRNLFALIPILLLIHLLGEWGALRTRNVGAHLRRCTFGTASQVLCFAAVGLLPLATATALTYTAPLFIGLFAMLFLGESVSRGRWLSLLCGFLGVYLIVLPGAGSVEPGVLVALAGAVATAAALLSIRTMSGEEKGSAVAFYFTVFGAVAGALSLWFDSVVPSLEELPVLVAIGLLGGAAQILLTFAYQNAPATLIAPFEYSTLVFASLIGFLVWADVPAGNELLGIAVIVGATTWLTLRERKVGA